MKLPQLLPAAALLGAVSLSLASAPQSSGQTAARNASARSAKPVTTTTVITSDTGTSTSAATNPVGFTTLTAVGNNNGSGGYNFLSLNMVRPALYRAIIPSSGVTGSNGQTILSFPNGTFTNDQFDGTGNACYFEVTNGTTAGLMANVVSTVASDANHGGASTITLDVDLSASLTPGTSTFLVRPHWTFATAFGANDSAGLQGSFSASGADNIQIIDPTTGAANNYYYNTTNSRWQNLGNDASNAIIPPSAGIVVQRKQTSTVSFVLVGEVKLGQTALTVVGGSSSNNANLIPNPYPLDSVTLANSNLYTGNAASGVVGSFAASGADNVGVLDPTTGVITNYYYNTTNSRWQTLGNDASAFTIPSGASVLITRKSGRPSFFWYVPQPAISL